MHTYLPSDYKCLAIYSKLRGLDKYDIEDEQVRASETNQPLTVVQRIPQLVGVTYVAPKWLEVADLTTLSNSHALLFIIALA